MGFSQIWAKFKLDAASAKEHYNSYSAVRRLTKQRKADGDALVLAYRDIGRSAAGTKAAEERKSYGAVKSNEQVVAECEAALAERQAEAGAAKAQYDARAAAKKAEIAAIEGEWGKAAEARKQSAAYLESVRKDIRDAQARIAVPPEKEAGLPPKADAEAKLAAANAALPAAEQGVAGWQAQETARQQQAAAAKQAWATEEATILADLKARADATSQAEKLADEAKSKLEGALQNLGESMAVAGSGMNVDALMEPLKRSSEIKARIQTTEQDLMKHRDICAANKAGMKRFYFAFGGAWLLVIGICVVLSIVL